MANPFDQLAGNNLDGLGSKLKKIGKKVSKTVKKASTQVLGKKVTKALSKVVQNPIVKTVAIGLATAGAASVLAKGAQAAKVGKVAGGINKLSKAAKTVKAVKTVKAIKNAVKKGGTVVAQVAKDPEIQQAAEKLQEAGATQAQIETAWVNSQAYQGAVASSVNQAVRPAIIQQLQSQGVPPAQINQAADYAIDQIAANAVETQKDSMGIGKLALIGIPIALALMGA
jgi:hypothetical protein